MLIYVGISVIVVLSDVFFKGITALSKIVNNLYKYDSVSTYIATIILFAAFLNITIEHRYAVRFIGMLSSATFGVYLIHANADVSPWLWKTLNLPQYIESPFFIIIQLATVACIFAGCSAADIFRKKTVGRIETSGPVLKMCNCIIKSVLNCFDRIIKD